MKKIIFAFLASVLLSHHAYAKDGDSKAEGTLEQISSTEAVVAGESYVISLTTQFEDKNGNHISSSLFVVGSRVEVKYQSISGQKVIREIELLSPGATPTPGASPTPDDDSGDDSNRRTNVKLPDDDSTASVKIELRRTGESKFKVQLNIPLPKGTPAPSRSDLVANKVTATLSRAATAYSICTMKFDGSTGANQKRKAEYKLEIKTNKQGTRIVNGSKGTCDLDLTTDGTQRGLPAVQSGDTITVESTNPALNIEGLIQ